MILLGAPPTSQIEESVSVHNGGSARGYLADLSRRERSGHHRRPRHDSDRGLDFYAGRHVPGTHAHAADRVERCGHRKDFGHAARSVGNRELRQPRTRADGEACHGEQPEPFARPRTVPPYLYRPTMQWLSRGLFGAGCPGFGRA